MTVPEKPTLEGLEAKWGQRWDADDTYRFPREPTAAPVYSIDTPPPTVSGELHVGHAFSYTHTDLIARYRRMRGDAVFYPIGWDDNGLPTERRVQNVFNVTCDPSLPYEEGFTREPQTDGKPLAISRRNFVELCLQLTEQDEQAFEGVWRHIGLSVDWSLAYTTISLPSQLVSQKAFLEDARAGRAYRSEQKPVPWDVDFRSTIAQAEIEDREETSAYHRLRFRAQDGRIVHVDTTRPELLPACVAVLVHPTDRRYDDLLGGQLITPGFGAKVPFLADETVDPEKGTGVVMVCTFGDVNDVAWWRQYKLPLRIMIDRGGRVEPLEWTPENAVDPAAAEAAYAPLVGLKLQPARKAVLELLAAADGLEGEPRKIKHFVRFYEKGTKPLELLLAPQWFLNISDDTEDYLRIGSELAWHPPGMETRYRNWVQAVNQDWAISRQRYFGVPFPAWYPVGADGEPDVYSPILATDAQLPVDPSIHIPEGFTEAQRDQPGGFTADPDVMDTWATSSLTPRIAAGAVSPELYDRLRPFSLRPQSHEIIRTWLYYTVVRAWSEYRETPWENVTISGWILDKNDRKKMSKSKGNVVTPMALLEQFGSDAVRYWAAKGRPGADTAFDEGMMKVGRRLATKLLNASRFILQAPSGAPAPETLWEVDAAMLARLDRTIAEATAAFDGYDYTRALETAERFFWWLTDDYLELVKRRFYGDAGEEGAASAAAALHQALDAQVRLFAPFLPFAAEEVWSWFREGSVHRASWPEASAERIAAAAGSSNGDGGDASAQAPADLLDLASDVLHGIRRVKSQANVKMRESVGLAKITAPAATLEQLEPLLQDVRFAGAIEAVELTVGDELAVVLEFDAAVG